MSEKLETWALVELFGHQKIAGMVTEQTIAGGSFLRVDVPAMDGAQGFTRFYGASAIYALTPTTEGIARRAVHALQVRPISVYGVMVPERELTAQAEMLDDENGIGVPDDIPF